MGCLITSLTDTKSLLDSAHRPKQANSISLGCVPGQALARVAGKEPSMFRGKTEDSRRQVILLYHIFKNAGSTVESILKNNFRARLARFESDDYNSTVSNEALLEFLALHP